MQRQFQLREKGEIVEQGRLHVMLIEVIRMLIDFRSQEKSNAMVKLTSYRFDVPSSKVTTHVMQVKTEEMLV